MAWCRDLAINALDGMLQGICFLAPNGLLQLESPGDGAACCLFKQHAAPASFESGSSKQLVRSPGLHACYPSKTKHGSNHEFGHAQMRTEQHWGSDKPKS